VKPLPLQEILPIIGGTLIEGDPHFKVMNVQKNPKPLKHGTMFFQTKSKLSDSFNRYKKNIVIVTMKKLDTSQIPGNVSLVQVDDVKKAWKLFIHFYRSLFSIPVIGVTGTAGKTSTKEIIKHILEQDRSVQATYKSMNGLVLNEKYVLGIDHKTEAAVFEMGVSYPGNIRKAGDVFKPTIGVITNIGIAHLETCGSFERYLQAKGEMIEVVNQKGTLILNADDENTKLINVSSFKGKLVYFGQSPASDYRVSSINYESTGMGFVLHIHDESYRGGIPGWGQHNVYNALAAIAATHQMGLEIEDILNRLSTFNQVERHTAISTGLNQTIMIDDTWNANPSSTYAALNVLEEIGKQTKKIAVLGTLQRLGSKEEEEHRKLGTYVARSSIDQLVIVEERASSIGEAAKQAGMAMHNIHQVTSAEALDEKLGSLITKENVCLIKMSLDKMDGSYRSVVKKWVSGKENS
jgi:UDP-N-acetylmuramoyl-tripeptide--D-alanyl-D-alanine ligase